MMRLLNGLQPKCCQQTISIFGVYTFKCTTATKLTISGPLMKRDYYYYYYYFGQQCKVVYGIMFKFV